MPFTIELNDDERTVLMGILDAGIEQFETALRIAGSGLAEDERNSIEYILTHSQSIRKQLGL